MIPTRQSLFIEAIVASVDYQKSPVNPLYLPKEGLSTIFRIKFFWSFVDQQDMLRERCESRMLCADLVDIRWKDKSGRGHKVTALLEDISAYGACVQLDGPIHNNTSVKIYHLKGHHKR